MELIAVENSKIISLFWVAPRVSQPYLPHLAKLLIDRYNFQGVPKSIEELLSEKVSFSHGLFENSAIEQFDIYQDGIVVSARSESSILDRFMEDLRGWVEDELKLDYVQPHKVNKSYESNLLVRTEKNILSPLSKLKQIRESLSASVKQVMGLEVDFEAFGLSFNADVSTIAGLKPAQFRIERKLGVAFGMNYYVSQAPLPTRDHLELLKMFEELA